MSERDWVYGLAEMLLRNFSPEFNEGSPSPLTPAGEEIVNEMSVLIREAFAARQRKVEGLNEAILAGLQQAIRHGSNNPGTVQDILEYILPVIAARVAQAESDAYRRCARFTSSTAAEKRYALTVIFEDWAAEAESRARGEGR